MRAGVKSVAAVVLAASLASPALAQETIKMGALATLEGAFAVLGEDSMRGVRMALEEFDQTAGGKKIELVTGSSDRKRVVEGKGVLVRVDFSGRRVIQKKKINL